MQDEEGGFSLFAEVSGSGETVAHYGVAAVDPEHRELDQWIVAAAPGGFWAASGWSYVLERWVPAESRPSFRLERRVEWFPVDQTLPEDMYTDSPPPSWLTHLHERSNGQLWTYTTVPDRAWEPAPSERPNPRWTRETLDMMVEVLDPETGSLLATTRRDQLLAPICGSPLMYTVEETELGNTQVVILSPELRRGK